MIKRLLFYLFLVFIVFSVIKLPSANDRAIGQLPVLHEGRVKPLDTLARHFLLQIQGRLKLSGHQTPTQWFFSLLTQENAFKNETTILVEHPKLFDSIDPKYRKQKYRISEAFLDENFDIIQPFVAAAVQLEKEQRTPFQQATFVLTNRYQTQLSLRQQFFPLKNGSQLDFWNSMLTLTQSMQNDQIQDSPNFANFLNYYNQLQDNKSTTYLVFGGEWQTLSESALNPTKTKKRTFIKLFALI